MSSIAQNHLLTLHATDLQVYNKFEYELKTNISLYPQKKSDKDEK